MVTLWAAFPRARTLRRALLLRVGLYLYGVSVQPPRRVIGGAWCSVCDHILVSPPAKVCEHGGALRMVPSRLRS